MCPSSFVILFPDLCSIGVSLKVFSGFSVPDDFARKSLLQGTNKIDMFKASIISFVEIFHAGKNLVCHSILIATP